jgi:hypothetical protein
MTLLREAQFQSKEACKESLQCKQGAGALGNNPAVGEWAQNAPLRQIFQYLGSFSSADTVGKEGSNLRLECPIVTDERG